MQKRFNDKDLDEIKKTSDFKGWDEVYEDIAKQFEKILNATFDKVSKQISNGTQKKIEVLGQEKNKCLNEIQSMKDRLKNLLDENGVNESIGPLENKVKLIQKDIDKWESLKTDTNKHMQSK